MWPSLQRFYTTCFCFDPATLGGVRHCLREGWQPDFGGLPPHGIHLQRFYTTCYKPFDPAPLGGVGHCLQYPFLEATPNPACGALPWKKQVRLMKVTSIAKDVSSLPLLTPPRFTEPVDSFKEKNYFCLRLDKRSCSSMDRTKVS